MSGRPTTIPKPAERDEWLLAREPYVGASDAACLLGKHPYKTLGALAREKLTGERQPENRAMLRGRRLEAAVAAWYSDELGIALEEPDVLYVDGTGSLCATLDRRVVGSSTGVEIKTTNHYVRTPPEHWLIQAQVQMLCAGLERVELAVLDARMDLEIYPVLPHRGMQLTLSQLAGQFLEAVRAGEYPEGLEDDWDLATALHPEPDPDAAIDIDEDTLKLVRSLGMVRQRIKGLENESDVLRARIARRLGDAGVGRYDGAKVVTYAHRHRRGIDRRRLERDYPDIAADYGTESSYHEIRVWA